MKPKAFLVYGSEDRHRYLIFTMAFYLKAIGCSVQVCSTSNKKFWSKLDQTINALLPQQPFLLTYYGHGGPEGWENDIAYRNIVSMLKLIEGTVLFLNYTCHGAKAVKHLKQHRAPSKTGFIAPFDAYHLSYASVALAEALEYWSRSKVLDDCVSRITICNEDKDVNLPIQIRWGARLDTLLFPKREGQALHLLEYQH